MLSTHPQHGRARSLIHRDADPPTSSSPLRRLAVASNIGLKTETRTPKDHLNNVVKFTSLGKYRNKKDRGTSTSRVECRRARLAFPSPLLSIRARVLVC